eukprot:CAMPEP_0113918138 /NCGR_PEP_ID=MMETSP0780_2-20120614/33159_1 /TAXON_ID=652834 /ORGANISM="Palpitomonas bilix" /LENGTH=681 /DNA_ID=CAMNT_0000917861 /DNA_START=183 /DNA_END=2228 /DNA_ORIENTATION=- /assembly_acc=CAM_ASM_000599
MSMLPDNVRMKRESVYRDLIRLIRHYQYGLHTLVHGTKGLDLHSFKGQDLVEWLVKLHSTSDCPAFIDMVKDVVGVKVGGATPEKKKMLRRITVQQQTSSGAIQESQLFGPELASKLGKIMLEDGWLESADTNEFEPLETEYHFAKKHDFLVLNGQVDCKQQGMLDPTQKVGEMMDKLVEIVRPLQQRMQVLPSHASLKQSAQFRSFSDSAVGLQMLDMKAVMCLPALQRTSLFINIFNALLVHSHLTRPAEVPKGRYDIDPFFRNNAYLIGGVVFTLNDILHGVLRANTKSFHSDEDGEYFEVYDPRLPFAIAEEDFHALIHFGLNYGSAEDVALLKYSGDTLLDDLQENAKRYCRLHVSAAPGRDEVTISERIGWIARDVKRGGGGGSKQEAQRDLMSWLLRFVSDDVADMIKDKMQAAWEAGKETLGFKLVTQRWGGRSLFVTEKDLEEHKKTVGYHLPLSVVLEGWMAKKCKHYGLDKLSWKMRYFVLEKGKLFYYDDAKKREKNLKNVMILVQKISKQWQDYLMGKGAAPKGVVPPPQDPPKGKKHQVKVTIQNKVSVQYPPAGASSTPKQTPGGSGGETGRGLSDDEDAPAKRRLSNTRLKSRRKTLANVENDPNQFEVKIQMGEERKVLEKEGVQYSYQFTIISGEHKVLVAADTEEKRTLWMGALEGAIVRPR